MFTPAFHDLLKPQWLATLSELKVSGGLAISELSRRLGTSYMTVKQHCEDLTDRGYLKRSRVPRTEIGRPEIFYRLSEKADALFPTVSVGFTLEMLDQVRLLFGENAPERLLFQYFEKQGEGWKVQLGKGISVISKVKLFTKLREKEGLFLECIHDQETGRIILREFHHPLFRIFQAYPRAIMLEQRAVEDALGARVKREVPESMGGEKGFVDLVIQVS